MENFNMVCALVCGLNMRSSMTAKITKGPPYCHHTLVGPPSPEKKLKYSCTPMDWERGIKGGFWVTCGQDLGCLSAGFRLELAGTYEEIYPWRKKYQTIRIYTPTVLAVAKTTQKCQNGVFGGYGWFLVKAKTVGIHFLIFWYFSLHSYISSYLQAKV